MKKLTFIIIVVVSAAATGGLLLHFKSKPQTAAASPAGIQQVSLTADKAEPVIVFVKVGEQVQFNSQDASQHDIGPGEAAGVDHQHALQSGSGIQSGVFGPGEAYRASFRTPGTYAFHDHLHPTVAVTVVAYLPSQGK